MKKLWEDPDFRERQLKKLRAAMCLRPTSPEKKLIEILERHKLPFEYVGDGRVILQGYSPDFINVDGRKQIIEVFGDYWHNRAHIPWHQTELGRIMAYNSLGFDCLILWEHDINSKSEEELVDEIKAFARRR